MNTEYTHTFTLKSTSALALINALKDEYQGWHATKVWAKDIKERWYTPTKRYYFMLIKKPKETINIKIGPIKIKPQPKVHINIGPVKARI